MLVADLGFSEAILKHSTRVWRGVENFYPIMLEMFTGAVNTLGAEVR
jgi:hypothetical protein